MSRFLRLSATRAALVGTLALTLASLADAQRTQPGGDKDAVGGRGVYQKVLKSTVWVVIPEDVGGGRTRLITGSGTLVDVPNRLVLTNYHVVRAAPAARIMFPVFNKGELVAEREFYQNLVVRSQGGLLGKVVAKAERVDLALVQLDKLPPGAAALRLAQNSVGPGEDVHSIGNPAASGGLWIYTPGKVRQVYQKRWAAKAGGEELQFEARVIETDSQTNPGDSGGPLANDRGELVGVTQGGAVQAASLSTFIHLNEIKNFLKTSGHGRIVTQPAAVTSSVTETKAEDKAPPKDPAADKAEKAEKEAAGKLVLAQAFFKDRPERARERLEDIIKNYPETKAAQDAKALLAKLKK